MTAFLQLIQNTSSLNTETSVLLFWRMDLTAEGAKKRKNIQRIVTMTSENRKGEKKNLTLKSLNDKH